MNPLTDKRGANCFEGPPGPKLKICHIIMSCNRINYLIPTLQSIHKIDFGYTDVYRILIDDYPDGRNNELFTQLAWTYGVDELILNQENKGLSVVWTELYALLKERDFDYILHQEDDVILLNPIDMYDWLEILTTHENTCSAVLTRQPWYPGEEPFRALDTDEIINNYRVEYNNHVFSPMFSLYSAQILHEPFVEYWGVNLNEGMIMQYLHYRNMRCAYLKDAGGNNLIEHIGEYFTGRRILPGEPGWKQFKEFNPTQRYCSRTGLKYL